MTDCPLIAWSMTTAADEHVDAHVRPATGEEAVADGVAAGERIAHRSRSGRHHRQVDRVRRLRRLGGAGGSSRETRTLGSSLSRRLLGLLLFDLLGRRRRVALAAEIDRLLGCVGIGGDDERLRVFGGDLLEGLRLVRRKGDGPVGGETDGGDETADHAEDHETAQRAAGRGSRRGLRRRSGGLRRGRAAGHALLRTGSHLSRSLAAARHGNVGLFVRVVLFSQVNPPAPRRRGR